MKVALIHDWLNGMRGGEKVLEGLCDLYPDAPIYTLLYEPEKCSDKIKQHQVVTSFIQNLPWARKYYRHYLPLFPTAIEQFDLRGFDLVISTSHCVAKGVLVPPGTLHLCYCHTPMRYAWEQYHEYFPSDQLSWWQRKIIPLAMTALRQWDVVASNRVDQFIANSRHVAKRIKKYYHREALVVHPPVAGQRFSIASETEDYYLVVSAMVPYKRLDRAIRAFNHLKKRLLVVGSGPELKKLKKLAGPTVTFESHCSEEHLTHLYERCRAFIFPGEEDFGITPLEAMAAGRPVIAYGVGGALETVVPNRTGLFFYEPTAEALAAAVQEAETVTWQSQAIRDHALTFDYDHFKKNLQSVIKQQVRDWQTS